MRVRTRLTLWYSAILLGILVVIGALSYSVLRWSLMQDLDASLLTVAQVINDTRPDDADDSELEAFLRHLLGPEWYWYQQFFQLRDPARRAFALPFSAQARANAEHGIRTFETIAHDRDEVRVLTAPVIEEGRL